MGFDQKFDLGFVELKSPEMVYYEIVRHVVDNSNNISDNDSLVAIHSLNYYTYNDWLEKSYVYTDDIELSDCVRLNFYFSYKRTYIGMYKFDKETGLVGVLDSTDFAKLQYLLLIYCDKILLKYRLHEFIYDV